MTTGHATAVWLAAAVVAAVGVSGCDAAPAGHGAGRQVTVVGSGEVKGVPDTLTADIGVETTAPEATAAMNQASDRQRAVLDALAARGIDDKDIRTTSVTLQPQFGDAVGSAPAPITGYRATNSVSVTLRELEAASTTLATVVNAGGNSTRINSVSYSIDDDSRLVAEARARAFNDARERAEQYAELAGLGLGTVISISEDSGGAPPPVNGPAPRNAPMAADVPLEPGEQTVSFTVTAVWELR